MREIKTHEVDELGPTMSVWAVDEPGPGGACHHYRVIWDPDRTADSAIPIAYRDGKPPQYIDIHFQKGPRGENDCNGLLEPALLAIIEDRMVSFQQGPFSSVEGSQALGAVRLALSYLHDRVRDRLRRGVQGLSKT